MRTITKIACRTMGTVGMGVALYEAGNVAAQFSKNAAQEVQGRYLEKAFYDGRTLDDVSYTSNGIRQTTFNLRTRNPLPTLWGRIKGGFNGAMYGLGNNLPIIICSALALTTKNIFAKLGATGVAIALGYNVIRSGFGIGKHHPMD